MRKLIYLLNLLLAVWLLRKNKLEKRTNEVIVIDIIKLVIC